MIEPLPIQFRKSERIYRQLARSGIVALYEVRNQRHVLIGFELILVRYQKAHSRDQWKYPETERYPTDEHFGHYAWSVPNASRALAELIFEDLAARLARNRSDYCCNEDFYRLKGKDSHPLKPSLYVNRFLTGRRLPKTPRRTNRTKPATETMSDQN